MHIYFSGIGGSGIGPLALIAKQAGYEVSGSDISDGSYISYLKKHGIEDISIGQTTEQIKSWHAKNPIDWYVYSSALPKTDPDHPELIFCQKNGIKSSRRDEFLNQIIKDKGLKLLAIAGTHGKTTVTAMAVWVFKQLGLPISYSVGAKINFGDMGEYDSSSKYFIYEADEYDRNFLSFYPQMSIITGVDWDHPDVYPSRENYYEAFREFIDQSDQVVMWHDDAQALVIEATRKFTILERGDTSIDRQLNLLGRVNRANAWQVANSLEEITGKTVDELTACLNKFPGVSRRFEKITDNIYSDYAHTPPKIRGAIQLAQEAINKPAAADTVRESGVVIVYEGLHNTRQHFIKDELKDIFDKVKQLYIVPTYLAREDKNLSLLSPTKLLDLLSTSSKEHSATAELNEELAKALKDHASSGDLVLCLSAGGAGSLDEWLRKTF